MTKIREEPYGNVIEWGMLQDCDLNGCPIPCDNAGQVYPVSGTPLDTAEPTEFRGHTVRWVKRLTTYGRWLEPKSSLPKHQPPAITHGQFVESLQIAHDADQVLPPQ